MKYTTNYLKVNTVLFKLVVLFFLSSVAKADILYDPNFDTEDVIANAYHLGVLLSVEQGPAIPWDSGQLISGAKTIYIVAHGNQNKCGGILPEDFVTILSSRGLSDGATIYFPVCDIGAGDFLLSLASELESVGYTALTLIGATGGVAPIPNVAPYYAFVDKNTEDCQKITKNIIESVGEKYQFAKLEEELIKVWEETDKTHIDFIEWSIRVAADEQYQAANVEAFLLTLDADCFKDPGDAWLTARVPKD